MCYGVDHVAVFVMHVSWCGPCRGVCNACVMVWIMSRCLQCMCHGVDHVAVFVMHVSWCGPCRGVCNACVMVWIMSRCL